MTDRLPTADRHSSVTDPRVEYAVHDIGDQVAEHDEHGSEQEDTHQDGIITHGESVEKEAAHARPGIDGLNQYCSSKIERHVDANHRHERNQCVAQDVTEKHALLVHALGTCGADIILTQ